MITIKDKAVRDYLNGLKDPQKSIVLEIREVVLSTDNRVKEAIKWGSIAFYNKKNICGFRVAKSHVTLLFMEGASLRVPNILSGDGNKARTYKVSNVKDIDKTSLSRLVKESLDLGM